MPDPLLTIVATDIQTGALLLDHMNDAVQVTRYYTFLDPDGNPILLLGPQESGHVVSIPDIPATVRAALVLLDNWTRDLILESLQTDDA